LRFSHLFLQIDDDPAAPMDFAASAFACLVAETFVEQTALLRPGQGDNGESAAEASLFRGG